MTLTGRNARLFYDGDHWQGGEAWGGPRPDPLTTKPEDVTAYIEKIRRLFTSSNVVAEVVDRHVSAVIGREPSWQFVEKDAKEGEGEGPKVPMPGEDKIQPQSNKQVDEIEAAITDWIDRRNAHRMVMEATADFATTGHGLLRLFVPPGLLQDDTGGGKLVPTGLALADALDLIYIEKVDPAAGGTACERSTMATAAYVQWEEKVEEKTEKRSELQYIERAGRSKTTVVRYWEGNQKAAEMRLDLGGLLLMHQLRGRGIVTEQVMQLQKALNFAMTAMGNNNSNAGFMERIITNAQAPGTYEAGPNGTKVFKPADRYPGGAGSTVFLTGHPITAEDGNVTGYTTPTPHWRDPSSPEAFTSSLDEYRHAIYMEVKQGHLVAQGDGSVSGASRIHLRADFEVSLRDTKTATEDAYRWLLAALAKTASLFTGNPAEYDNLRPTVAANVNTGPLTDLERQAIVDQYKQGLRSRESAMVLLGVNDPDAEFERIMGEKPSNPVDLETLAILAIELLPEHKASLMIRAGLEVTKEQLVELQAAHESNSQARRAAAAARDRGFNPQDDPLPPRDGNAQ